MYQNIALGFFASIAASFSITYVLSAPWVSTFFIIWGALWINNSIAILANHDPPYFDEINAHLSKVFNGKNDFGFWFWSLLLASLIDRISNIPFMQILVILWSVLWLNMLVVLVTENAPNRFGNESHAKNANRIPFTICRLLMTLVLFLLAGGFYAWGF